MIQTKLYFAYGSNMEGEQMARRCPDSIAIGPATLQGWQWVINRRGVATIHPLPSANVEGVLFAISDADEATLDKCEGVSIGAYERLALSVELEDGRSVRALVYVDHRTAQGTPRPNYLQRCQRGARAWGLQGALRAMRNYA